MCWSVRAGASENAVRWARESMDSLALRGFVNTRVL